MPSSTESNQKKIRDLRKDLAGCNDPYALLAEALNEAERLREQLRRISTRR